MHKTKGWQLSKEVSSGWAPVMMTEHDLGNLHRLKQAPPAGLRSGAYFAERP